MVISVKLPGEKGTVTHWEAKPGETVQIRTRYTTDTGVIEEVNVSLANHHGKLEINKRKG